MPRHATRHLAAIVGANLRAARMARDLTQREVGEQLGVEGLFVSRWERGENAPSPANLQRIADLFFDGDVGALYQEPVAA